MRIYIIILLSIILFGCRHNSEANRALDHADAQMETAPDSAYETLQAIDTSDLPDKLSARHALLSSLALIKLGYLTTDDSLINVAASYYQSQPESDGWMKTLYFKADNAHNRGELGKAMSYLMEAKDIAQTRNDIYWNAKITELISDVFSDSYNTEENAKYALEAAHLYGKANKQRNERFVLIDYALTQIFLGDFNSGLTCIDSICTLACSNTQDSMLMEYCYWTKFNALLLTEKYSEGNDFVKTIPIEKFATFDNSRSHSLLARLKLHSDNTAEALAHINKAEILANSYDDTLSLYTSKSIYYGAIKDWQKAKEYADSLITIQNKLSEMMLSESVLSSMRDYYSSIATIEEYHAQNMSVIAYTSITIGVIFILVLFIIHRILLKTKRLELDSRIKDIAILSQQLSQKNVLNKSLFDAIACKDSEITELQFQINQQNSLISHVKENLETEHTKLKSEMIGLFKNRWHTINILCSQYLEMDDSEQTRIIIGKNITAEILKLKDKKVIQGIKDSVNLYMNGIVDKMSSSKTIFKPDDVTFLTLIIAGFLPRAVCVIMDLKVKNFYTKRKRLITRIEASELDYKEELLSLLN